MIARRGLRRPQPGRWASVLFGVLVIVSLVAGLLHSTGVLVYIGPLTAMDFHVGAAIAAVPFAVWPVVARRGPGRAADPSRRNGVRGGVVGAGAAPSLRGGHPAVKPPRPPCAAPPS